MAVVKFSDNFLDPFVPDIRFCEGNKLFGPVWYSEKLKFF